MDDVEGVSLLIASEESLSVKFEMFAMLRVERAGLRCVGHVQAEWAGVYSPLVSLAGHS